MAERNMDAGILTDDTGTGTDGDYLGDSGPNTGVSPDHDEEYLGDIEPVTGVSLEHIFITDFEFIDKDGVEYEDTLREYEESIKAGHSLKVSIH